MLPNPSPPVTAVFGWSRSRGCGPARRQVNGSQPASRYLEAADAAVAIRPLTFFSLPNGPVATHRPSSRPLGPVNLSCGGGAAWQSAGVAIDDFPRQLASTRRFTLGVPRAVTVSRDGGRVLFLRTRGGEDPVTCLWRLDLADGAGDGGGGRDRLLAGPAAAWGFGAGGMADAERVRRERARELAAGIVAYSADAN